MSVILFTGRGVSICLAAWSHVPSRGISVPGPMFFWGGGGVLSKEGLCPGEGSLSRRWGLCRETPLSESEKQMVRILLGCFLVITSFSVT